VAVAGHWRKAAIKSRKPSRPVSLPQMRPDISGALLWGEARQDRIFAGISEIWAKEKNMSALPRYKMNEKNCKWCVNAKVTKGELVQCKHAKQTLSLQQVNENKDFDRNGEHQCGKFERA